VRRFEINISELEESIRQLGHLTQMLTAQHMHACAVVFTGHMIDLDTRKTPRFPSHLEHAAARAIGQVLRMLRDECHGNIVGLSSAARGGDVLFLEACRKLMVEAFVVIPFSREKFAETSVMGVASGSWLERYNSMLNLLGPDRVEIMTETASPEAFDRCNSRLIELAASMGRQVILLGLLDSEAIQENGGAAHFAAKVRSIGGRVEVIELNKLGKL
jgi:hypothetical protein